MTRSGKRKAAENPTEEAPPAKRTEQRTEASIEETEAAIAAAEQVAESTILVDTKPGAVPRVRSSFAPRSASGEVLSATDHEAFDHFLFKLLSFKADTNNYHVPKKEQPELHAWLQDLKREYKIYLMAQTGRQEEGGESETVASPPPPTPPSKLTDEQVKVLESLHIPLTSRGDDHWNRFYKLLGEYKERHGHVLVPRLSEFPGLGDWVTDQRRQYKSWKQGQATQLTNERREKLNELGFVWQVRNRPEWDIRYKELMAYKEEHGNCKVPQHYKPNKALGKWVAKQREQFKLLKQGKHSFLTPYRLERLTGAGFVWQVRNSLEPTEDITAAAVVAATTVETPLKEETAAPKAEETTEEAKQEEKEEAKTEEVQTLSV